MTLFFLFKLPTFPFLSSNATAQRMVLIQVPEWYKAWYSYNKPFKEEFRFIGVV